MRSFLTGVAAGYGIAIPVGAIAVLIVDTGVRRGFKRAAFAGAGAATADLVYAVVAAIGGAALAARAESIGDWFVYLSGAVLAVIGLRGLWRTRASRTGTGGTGGERQRYLGTYLRFLGLTIINPATVVYFAAIVIGLGVTAGMTLAEGSVFALGAFLASLSWQLALAAVGGFAGHRLSPRMQGVVSILGNLLILGFAVVIIVRPG